VTYAVGEVTPQARRLLTVAEECLRRGIAAAQPGNRLGDIGAAIQDYAESQGFSVVREWGGHGIGQRLHEPPSVPHTRVPDDGPRLRPGMVFTIEPMVNAGRPEWRMLRDGWTVVTADGALSAQFEHTVAITEHGAEILSKL
jgi:methionyl aminopeptidase